MSSLISREFSKLEISITQDQIDAVEHLVFQFETKPSHVLALNMPYLGVHKIVFGDIEHRMAFFEIFGVKEPKLKEIISHIPTINKNFQVASDPFNVFAIWIMHLSYSFISNKDVRNKFILNVGKLLYYKFFTSKINGASFKTGAVEAIMIATIEELSNKFDIKRYGTWKNVIIRKCDIFLYKTGSGDEDGGLHARAIEHPTSDYDLLYPITDASTRIGGQIVGVANVYYDLHKNGVRITDRSRVGEYEGEKYITQSTSMFDVMVASTFAELSSVSKFIEMDTVKFVGSHFQSASVPLIHQFLIQITQIVSDQSRTKDLEQTKKVHGKEVIIGIKKLVDLIIQSSYRYCIRRGLPISKKYVIFENVKNIFTSSRISDPNIVLAKESVGYLVEQVDLTNREATKSALRLAFIMYIILKSMKYSNT